MADHEGILKDLHTKETHRTLNDETWESIKQSYHSKKALFEERYGPVVAAVSSRQFRLMRRDESPDK